ncbi:MAG: MBOAT family protein [Bacteroidales bacterium]|nr:MBOAT family protein [Bacteroidales bacterium]
MLFTSLQFALFLPVTFAVYWLLRSRPRLQNMAVLVASYVFYGWWDWHCLLLIAFTSLASFVSGMAMERLSSQRAVKAVMWCNVALNLGILGLFKYYDFFAQQFADVFLAGQGDALLLHLILPVGISFYTFQALSYTIDVRRGTVRPTHDIVAFMAYVAFFPQLVAGPIERATNLLPQFERQRHFDYALAVDGLRQMLWGFFKKMVVADSCALYVDAVFGSVDGHNSVTLAVAALCFSIQIYADFSGYSNIAIGCAKLFDINLRRNFATPYFSRDVAEFWRRWHISLTTWFRDYLYIPLGGSRCSKPRVLLNTLIIFLVSGFWHGANWTFICWGLFHAVLFMPLIMAGKNRRYLDVVASRDKLPSFRELLQMSGTFVLVTFGWILFRCNSIGDWWRFMQGLVHGGWGRPWEGAPHDFLIIALSVSVMLLVEWLNRDSTHEFARLPRRRWLRWGCYIVLIFMILALMPTGEMPFVYFQF